MGFAIFSHKDGLLEKIRQQILFFFSIWNYHGLY